MAALTLFVSAPLVSAGEGCNSRACEQRVKAREYAKHHGGCYSPRCTERVRARMARSTPRGIGRRLAFEHGQPWRCVDELVRRESRWIVTATNPSSGAYGLPQSLPAHKMAAAGPNWRTSARTQLKWMFSYLKARYRGACRALAHHNARGWY